MSNLKIGWKLTIIISILAIIPLFLFGLYANKNLEKNIKTNIKTNFDVIGKNLLEKVNSVINSAKNDAMLQVQNEIMQDVISEDIDGRIEKWVSTIAKNNPYFKYIIITDANGKIISSNEVSFKGQLLKTINNDNLTFDVLQPVITKETFIIKEKINSSFDPTAPLGYYYILIDLDKIKNEVYSVKHGDLTQGELFSVSFYDKNKKKVIVPFSSDIFNEVYENLPSDESGNSILHDISISKKPFVLYLKTIDNKNVSNIQCLIIENSKEAYKSLNSLKRTSIGITLFVAFLVVLASLITGRLFSSYIVSIACMMEDIAQGEGDLTKRLVIKSQDEIGILGKWFNKFMDKLEILISDMTTIIFDVFKNMKKLESEITNVFNASNNQLKDVNLVNAAMEEISLSTNHINSIILKQKNDIQDIFNALNNMIKRIDEVKKDSQEMITKMNDGGAAIEELSCSIQDIASSVSDASNRARKTAEMSIIGNNSMIETSKNVKELKVSSLEASESMKNLRTTIGEIKTILGVIQDIADQTNLLALNASIEAARAGDAGRGFAVVADSVRQLAEKTGLSVKEISQMVNKIMSEFMKAFNIVENTATSVEKVEELSRNTSMQLQEINIQANEMAKIMETISVAATEQSRGTDLLLNVIQVINNVASDVAEKNTELWELGGNIRKYSDEILKNISSLASVVSQQNERTKEVKESVNELVESSKDLEKIAKNQMDNCKAVTLLVDNLLKLSKSFKIRNLSMEKGIKEII